MKKKVWILSRTACLFNDTILEMSLTNIPRYNIQKGRVDLWIDFFEGKRQKPNFNMIKFISRFDIKRLFIEQYNFHLNKKTPPYMLVMDSYSELVDRKFYYNNFTNKYFFAYSDDVIENSEKFLENDGLLQTDKILESYEIFFNQFRAYYPACPIIFILVPNKLEIREFFIIRSKIIKESILKISKKYYDFHVIEVPEEIVFNNPNDDFPYHYSKEVYEHLNQELSSKRLFKKLYDNNFLNQ